MFTIKYNGANLPSNVWLATIPQIRNSDIKRNRYSIPMRDGDLLGADVYRSSAYITLTLHTDWWHVTIETIKEMFSTEGVLQIFDGSINNDNYYDVIEVKEISEERKHGDYGRITYQFEVYPMEYFKDIVLNYDNETRTIFNRGSAIAKPIYTVQTTLSGYIKIGNNVRFEVDNSSAPLYIDTRRMITYDQYGELAEDEVNGDYKNLWLPVGSTAIEVSELEIDVVRKDGMYI